MKACRRSRLAGIRARTYSESSAPCASQLQAHLFGAVFERDNLDWQSREPATVGALAAAPGLEAQPRAHMQASLHAGLTVPQLRQLVDVLKTGGGQLMPMYAGPTVAMRHVAIRDTGRSIDRV
jgi:alkylhydroperoxidase/carboxymuconolactone decarboxylase family protein YurZ